MKVLAIERLRSAEWNETYKIRVNVEKSINHFKDSFCIAGFYPCFQSGLRTCFAITYYPFLITSSTEIYLYNGTVIHLINNLLKYHINLSDAPVSDYLGSFANLEYPVRQIKNIIPHRSGMAFDHTNN